MRSSESHRMSAGRVRQAGISSESSPGSRSIQKTLKQDTGSGAVDFGALGAVARACRREPFLSLDGAEPFIEELDIHACFVGERLREGHGAAGGRTERAVHFNGQPDDDFLNAFALNDVREGRDELVSVVSAEGGPWMREQPELIGDGDARAGFSIVNREHAGRSVWAFRGRVACAHGRNVWSGG